MTLPPVVIAASDPASIPLWLVTETSYANWLTEQSAPVRNWLSAQRFKPERSRTLAWSDADGAPRGAVLGLGNLADVNSLSCWHTAGIAERLPDASYRIATPLAPAASYQAALGWWLGHYRSGLYKPPPPSQSGALGSVVAPGVRLECPPGVDLERLRFTVEAQHWVRDLINTPACDLGPEELAAQATALAQEHGAEISITTGEALLANNYPLIHAVGRASSRAPRLIDLRWRGVAAGKDSGVPRRRVTLVGKGVCFDTGGLDLKASAGMALMKKDMGGAAVALGVARIVMREQLPVDLRVLIPAVENSVAGNAMRPGDVLRSRRGLTIEVGNTDAEGRLILADALTAADAEQPDLLLDFATLTGAARVALGPELPAVFTDDLALRQAILDSAAQEHDPVWPLPMWDSYDEELASRIADLGNVASHGMGGAIFGALFLRRFVSRGRRWAHFDLYGWNSRERVGRPVGAEAQCMRLAANLIRHCL